LSQYHGIDWLAMCLTFAAIYLLGSKRRSGFVLMIAGNFLWCAIGTWAHSYAMIVANLGFLAMNIRGFAKWTNSEAEAKSQAP
jgi:nicotinamide riboside transporter PnuC